MASSLSALDRLRLFLRPPGLGIPTVSTGGGLSTTVLRAIYGTDVLKQVHTAWEDSLQRLRRVDTVLLGIPSDTGAGILRGANLGPIGVREAYFAVLGGYPKNVLDLGDVVCVPQLLHDSMLSDSQIRATREALYGDKGDGLPVSPLSIAEAALAAIRELNPGARVCLLGGDHSVSWPAMVDCHARFGDDFAVLHFDAHTDLLEHRYGVKYCFATWALHGMRLARPNRFVQVGIRTSSKPKEYWMEKHPLLQVWASDVRGREDEAAADVLRYFQESGATRLYISNDIDGTDAEAAPATGTPEVDGLSPDFVSALVTAASREFEVIGGDVVEVAPPLSGSRDFAAERTCRLGARYLSTLLEGMN